MQQYTIHQAKTHLSRLIREALSGDEIIIAKGSRPLIRLVPLEDACQKRRLGGAIGEITIADDFDAVLDDMVDYMT